MADAKGNQAAKEYHVGLEPEARVFPVKGAAHYDWGLQNRLGRIFDPKSGNTVMLAFDHGYIMGPTAGLERLDLVIPRLIPHVDVLMGTRGAIRTCVDPGVAKPVCLRATHDESVLKDDMTTGSGFGLDMEEVIRLNAQMIAIQTFVGAPGERDSIETLCRAVDRGNRYGIPVLGVVAVGKDMARTTEFFLLATRLLAENGAHAIKTYYCEGFEKVAAACPAPLIVAGGKKIPENEALSMVYRAVSEGARGIDMGRNIFQSASPVAMAKAIGKIVHEGKNDAEAFRFFNEEAARAEKA
ncbi:MAG: 3-hydroxy-5-phosphonooxypentane-2,4-dione thiolase [Fusobacteriaceae bacterium]|jgi:putative autoinducer-2 (AI-2) aldolase|nr:3-hydroxy-5-phosphonooxypentane-2,4-dione thiolase [Fusobacteriaceae bacterium]